MMYDSISQAQANQARQIGMENITIRKGRPEDAHDFSELALYTGPELLPALFGTTENEDSAFCNDFVCHCY